uniref:Transcription termination factor 2 n=1 Tax=Salarias fasciatus TaxID=181472 RepID=A0A672GU86_SALFA
MEKVSCHVHGSLCMLKTGVNEGPNKGKSFYVCVDKQGCTFSQNTRYSRTVKSENVCMRCQLYLHECYMKTIRVSSLQPVKEKKGPLCDTLLQPSSLPPVRNPFKAPSKTDRTSQWQKIQSNGSDEKNGDVCYKAEGVGNYQKENVERDAKPSDTYRGKQLPPGMKVKKRLSDEESNASKDHRLENDAGKMESKPKEDPVTQSETEEKMVPAAVTSIQSKKKNQTSPDPLKKSPQQPSKTKQTEDTVKRNSCNLEPGSSNHANRHADVPSKAKSDAPTSESSQTAADLSSDEDDDDDVVLVSVKPAPQKTPPVSAVQKTLTTFPGFQPAAKVKGQLGDPKGMHVLLTSQLKQKKVSRLLAGRDWPDRPQHHTFFILTNFVSCGQGSSVLSFTQFHIVIYSNNVLPFKESFKSFSADHFVDYNPCSFPFPVNPQAHAFYGGRMTEDRLLAVKNATCEAIDHLHKSLESCPDAEAEAADPRGIKVSLLAHQRRALAWLLWRETQKPCGGILADDMGLGKTLTMIALILDQKIKAKEEDEKKEGKKPEGWISKTDSTVVVSKGTLIICPASLIHHWKREIERHVKRGKLTVYLYHGPNRERSARVLADYDVVVTTYSLVSKEIPIEKEEAEKPSKDPDDVPSHSAPLLRVSWARLVLDEAHNIKNPKVQTSMAVCRLRAGARWAVTGTPIQNNLLDMYSLLKFLRCAPFDEYKLWKAQVDNGSARGRERLNILTRTLLLRRTKDQQDSTGKPLVSLPERTCEVHRIKLSADEQAVYDVVFTQSRSTLQNYLKKHEGTDVSKGKAPDSNPFERVAQEFGMSQADPAAPGSQQPQQASSTVHILSLLLRLRQCCCHLSLLKKTLDSSELQADGIVLSLEEQLNALSLSSSPSPSGPAPTDTVALNGARFPSKLFEETGESTKIAAIISELKAIREKSDDQKSVIVSQWTSMLKIVAVHLGQMGLKYGVIDGTINPKRRMDLVEDFNTNPRGPQVMLVSLCAGGVGLNLIGGNHLFLIDMHWNPALEDQACDRIYRVGQSKDVTIHRFVCEGTVEEKISSLQNRKKQLAQNVLSGTGKTVSKLSLADLRIIFGV